MVHPFKMGSESVSELRRCDHRDHHRGCEGTRDRPASQPRADLLLQGRSGDATLARYAKQLLESCLWYEALPVLPAELRSQEDFYYLRNVNSGPPGAHHECARGKRRVRLKNLLSKRLGG